MVNTQPLSESEKNDLLKVSEDVSKVISKVSEDVSKVISKFKKTINKSAKGWRKERECRKLLEQQGFTIVFKSIRWRWGTLDFGPGLFDSVAVKNADGEPIWLFVSNKHYGSAQTKFPQHQQAIRDFKEKYSLSHCQHMIFELWLWKRAHWVGRGVSRRWQEAKWEIIKL